MTGDLERWLARVEAEPHLPCDGSPSIDGLILRKRLGRKEWGVPDPHGCCGWQIRALDRPANIIVTADHASGHAEGAHWVHASISRPTQTPSYEDLKALHYAVFGPDRWAYQVFAPAEQHVNIHVHALHLWGRADGARVLPDFGRHGTI